MADDKDASPKPGSSKLMIILLVLLVVLALGGAGVAAYLLLQGGAPAPGAEKAQAVEATPPMAQLYFPLEPAFVVNFPGGGPVRFLQINLQVAARDKVVLDAVRDHEPAIRNDLVLLFGSQDPAVLNTLEGKEALRAETLAAIKRILKKQVGRDDVEDVYFTGFVMQ